MSAHALTDALSRHDGSTAAEAGCYGVTARCSDTGLSRNLLWDVADAIATPRGVAPARRRVGRR